MSADRMLTLAKEWAMAQDRADLIAREVRDMREGKNASICICRRDASGARYGVVEAVWETVPSLVHDALLGLLESALQQARKVEAGTREKVLNYAIEQRVGGEL